MNPVCKGCKFYLQAHRLQYCGLGYDPSTITECFNKEEGNSRKDDYQVEECSSLDYLYPLGKGLEQAPKKLLGLHYFSRKHKRLDKYIREVTITIVVDKYKLYFVNAYYYRMYPDQVMYSKYDYDKAIWTLIYKESIKEAFIKSRQKRNRQTIN